MQILITGTTGGIGSAIKKTLSETGATIVEINRNEIDFSSFSEIQNVSKTSLANTSFDWIIFAHGYVDAEKEFQKQKPEEIEKIFAINTLSVIYLTQLFLKNIPAGGGIIYLSSTAALTSNGFTPAYSASKAAINTFAQAISRNQSHLSLYSICPGPTATPMLEKLKGDMARAQSPDAVAQLIKNLIEKKTDYKSGDLIELRNGQPRLAAHLPD